MGNVEWGMRNAETALIIRTSVELRLAKLHRSGRVRPVSRLQKVTVGGTEELRVNLVEIAVVALEDRGEWLAEVG